MPYSCLMVNVTSGGDGRGELRRLISSYIISERAARREAGGEVPVVARERERKSE